ncbi:MAG: hypothetical protein LBK63_13105 [Treponema sp.]|jgi:hypothetical protein|nr:hypothetical protein [Treponema sp.]
MTKNMFRFVPGKLIGRAVKGIALLAGILFILSCDLPQGTENKDLESGKGSLYIVLPGGKQGSGNQIGGMERSVLSDDFIPTLRYQLNLTGPGEPVEQETAGGTVTVSLEPGEWTIVVEGRDPSDNDRLVGTGNETTTVILGKPVSVIIKMYVDTGYEADITDIYIHNEAELRRIGTDFAIDGSKTFHLENDITLIGPWDPIGDDGDHFKAVFNGDGHTIVINGGFGDLTAPVLGLFGYADDAEIKNLNIVWNIGSAGSPALLPMPNSSAVQTIGGLAGTLANASKVENVSVRGSFCFNQTGNTDGLLLGGVAGAGDDGSSIIKSSFSGTVNSGGWAGGITGSNYDSLIEKCHASGTITGGDGAGGIAGEMQNSGGASSIAASSFTGSVGAENLLYEAYAGGIVGYSSSGSIERCYAVGNIESQAPVAYAGGIVGDFGYFPVTDCYAYINVRSSGSTESYAGGIAGYASEIAKCYAEGMVKAEGSGTVVYAGGISGQVVNTGGLTNCVVILNALDGGASADVHTLFGGVYIGFANNTGNKVWDAIAIARGGTTYIKDSAPPFSGLALNPDKDIASFDSAADFKGSTNQSTYTGAGWDFTAETGDWKFISGYDFPVLSWQTLPPDLSYVPDSVSITWP